MGDELRGENLVHLNVGFSNETDLKRTQDLLYEKSGQGAAFTGLLEAMAHEVTIVTAVHNIKSNKGSKTAGVDKMNMDRYLQMPKEQLMHLIQSNFANYKPKPARREYIDKGNGKKTSSWHPNNSGQNHTGMYASDSGTDLRSTILST